MNAAASQPAAFFLPLWPGPANSYNMGTGREAHPKR